MYKSGFVAIIGRPNVGKSTLLNEIIGEKLSIISSTAQTTRNTIKGIYTTSDAQIVFLDTPGLHKPKNELGAFMNKESINSLKEVDAIIWIVDVNEEFGKGDEYVASLLKDIDVPLILCFNKIDLIEDESKAKLNEDSFKNACESKKVSFISAKSKTGIENLIEDIISLLDEGPKYYDDDQITDSIERFIVSELIREKIFYLTKDEIPHSVAVEIEDMVEKEDGVEIYACIVCERESQKKILVGSGASMIKKIKQYSKRDIKKLLNTNVYLEIFVKVDKDWRNNKTSLSRLGYKNRG